VADAIFSTEPAWIVVGAVLLVMRYRNGDAARRAELRWPLRALLVLAVMLALVIVFVVTGVDPTGDSPFAGGAFVLALSLFPIALLAAVVRRVRSLESRVVASRARLVEAEDATRRRLERDLHDGVQQQLAAIQSLVQLAARQVGRDPALAAETLTEIAAETQDATRSLRHVVGGIHPAVLTDGGLAAAVEARLQRLPLASMLHVHDGVRTRRWSAAAEGAAYFAVCEALTNALKHAQASRVDVRIDGDATTIAIEVHDDGLGYDPDRVTERGLLGLRDRVESLDGQVAVTSAPGQGTHITIRVPAEERR